LLWQGCFMRRLNASRRPNPINPKNKKGLANEITIID